MLKMPRSIAGWRLIIPVAVAAVAAGTAATALADTPPSSVHVVSLAKAGRSQASLKIAAGEPGLQVSVARLGSTLIQVSTPGNAPVSPVLSASGPIVLSLTHAPSSGVRGHHDHQYTVKIVLNSAVAWNIDVAGGTKQTVANLRGGKVDGITVAAGSKIFDLSLPKPAGTLPFQLAAGVSQLAINLPAGVATAVTAGRGATYVTMGSQSATKVADGTVLTSPGWATATSRLKVDATRGVSHLTVSQG
jgi:hypothetical protein